MGQVDQTEIGHQVDHQVDHQAGLQLSQEALALVNQWDPAKCPGLEWHREDQGKL